LQIKIALFSVFREKLPPENRGRATIELPEGATLADLLAKLEINITAICSLNGQIERDFSKQLADADEVHIFRPVGGGAHRD
jgi:sulfur carrier protein ThiS